MVFDELAAPFSLANYKLNALVVKVYDGDTIKAVFPIPGLPKDYRWDCRILGIDTPELRRSSDHEKKWGLRARDRLRELILGKEVILDLGEFDKYGRVLTKVYLLDGTDVGDKLIEEDLARPYTGKGAKTLWDDLTFVGNL